MHNHALLITGLTLVLTGSAAATPTGSLTQLAQRYQCTYPDDTRQIQCVMAMIRAHCTQERLSLRSVAGATPTDPAVKEFDKCMGGSGADPFESEFSSWAAAEVYLDRGLALLGGRDDEAGSEYVRTVPPTTAVVRPAEGVASIQAACATARTRRDDLVVRLANASLSKGMTYEAKQLIAIERGLAKCDTIVKNGWGSAVGIPIYLHEALGLAETIIATGEAQE